MEVKGMFGCNAVFGSDAINAFSYIMSGGCITILTTQMHNLI